MLLPKIKIEKISTKIFISFTVIIILFIFVLILNIYLINNINSTRTTLANSNTILTLINNLEKHTSIEKNIHTSVITSGRTSSSSGLYSEAYNEFRKNSKKLSAFSHQLSKEELDLLKNIQNFHEEYYNVFLNKSLIIGREVFNGQIKDIKIDKLRIDTLKILDKISANFESNFKSFNSLQQKNLDSLNKSIEKQFLYMIYYFICAVVFAILLTFILSFLLSKSILKKLDTSINMFTSWAKSLGEGDLNIQIKESKNDEMSFFIIAFSDTIKKLRSVIENVYKTSDLVVETSDKVVSYNGQVKQNIDITSSLINDIDAKAQSQQNNILDIYKNSNNITNIIGGISQSVSSLLEYSNQTNSIGVDSVENLEKTVNHITTINNDIHYTASLVQNLNSKSKQIESIVDIINKVASQTNLLSLNASIEAARAGELGKSFSVVAEEIRKLAIQVGDSSSGILEIVKNINSEIDSIYNNINSNIKTSKTGLSLVSSTADSFKTIISSVTHQKEKITILSRNIDLLVNNIDGINLSIQDILNSSKNITISTENASDKTNDQLNISNDLLNTATSLSEVAIQLKNVISIFKL